MYTVRDTGYEWGYNEGWHATSAFNVRCQGTAYIISNQEKYSMRSWFSEFFSFFFRGVNMSWHYQAPKCDDSCQSSLLAQKNPQV